MRTRTIIGIAAATVAFTAAGATPPSASAAPVCTAIDGLQPQGEPPTLTICVDAGQAAGTVAPTVTLTICIGRLGCSESELVRVGPTGFVLDGSSSTIQIDPDTLSIRYSGGTIGTVWLDGTPRQISVPAFCVGGGCAGPLTP